MAKAKKEAALTPEERLQAALIPDWEWPYKLPENWCWIILGKAVSIKRGASPRPIKQYITESPNGVNWIKIGDTNDGKYVTSIKEKITPDGAQKSVFVEKGSLLLSNSMSFGRPYILNVDGCIHDGWLAINPSEGLDKVFLYYALLASKWYFEQVAVGTAVRNLNSDRVSNTPVPLPPLAEQRRIVDRIESLFAKLDEAKEKAQAVVDSFETRKAAILHKAFTGELTAEWRNNTDIIWDYQKIKNCCNMGSGGTPSRKNSEYYNGNIPWIKTGEIEWNNIYDSEEKITESAIDNSSAKCYEPGAVLVAMYGMGVTRGKAGILCVRAATNQAVCVLEPAEDVLNNRFLLYYFMRNYWSIREKSVGGNQLNLSGTIIKELDIAIPPLDEQKEIVCILDNLFAKEQQAKEAADAVLDQIDLMKKSILARAFRGELSTNDPTDEPAVELLKKVLDIPSEPKQTVKRTMIPKELESRINTALERKIVKAILKQESQTISLEELGYISRDTLGILESIQKLEKKNVIEMVSPECYRIKE